MKRSFKLIRNHIITGFIFLMPVLISIAVIAKFWNRLLGLGKKISRVFRIDTLLGTSGDAVVAVILLLTFCVIAGFLVKLSVFKRMSDSLDEHLSHFIPGYNDLRKQAEIKVGVGSKKEIFEACLVQTQDHWKPAYLIEIANNGEATVFLPTAPNFNTGQVEIVPADCYKKLNFDSATLNSYLKRLGKGISQT